MGANEDPMYADREACLSIGNVKTNPSTWASDIAFHDVDDIIDLGPEEGDAIVTTRARISCVLVASFIDAEPQGDLKLAVFETSDGGLRVIIDRPDGTKRLSIEINPYGGFAIIEVTPFSTRKVGYLDGAEHITRLIEWLR